MSNAKVQSFVLGCIVLFLRESSYLKVIKDSKGDDLESVKGPEVVRRKAADNFRAAKLLKEAAEQ